ncbi:GRB2-associated-binding protein 3 [Amia ocellicauda]|uniref:GRB2-associated-binding protein 3 n=1 Tax=Amia ocellicauda TaxID=2972642 RepID=UPI003464C5ED
MSAGDVVCTGWLIKSPPEKKLKRYAWRKRWFVLRRGRMSGNPDVLEYYRNKTAKKPIRVIDLNECEVKMHTEVRVVKREFQNHHVFVVKTSFRIFYLVAKTEEEMNNWVHNISQICHFGPLDDTASVDSLSQTPSSQQPSPAIARVTDDGQFSNHDLTADTNTTEESRSESESSLPPDYLILSQCETGRIGITRCNSWSTSERSLEQNSSDNTFEDVFLSPLCPNQPFSPFPSLGPSESPPSNPPFDRPSDFASSSPLAISRLPDVFQFDKPLPPVLPLEGSADGATPPPRPPKPSRFSERWKDDCSPHLMLKNGDGAYAVQPGIIPRRISLAGLDHVRRGEFEDATVRSWNKRLSLNLSQPAAVYSPSSVDSYEDSYVPMNPGASPPVSTLDCSPDGYIPMSPTTVKFLLSTVKAEMGPVPSPLSELPADLEPPPVNRDLKPRRRARPPPLDLRGLSTIRENSTHVPLTRALTEPCRPTHCVSLEGRLGVGGVAGEQEDISTESKQLIFPSNGTPNLSWPRKINLDYLSLDFNSASPSPVQKKPLLADEHRVDYVQVDEKKTQALQNTKMEWKDVRQSKV